MSRVSGFGQYNDDFFNKLNFNLEKGKTILDVGCGPGTDAEIFIKAYGLKVYGIDIYEDENIKNLKLNFKKGTIYKIPYKDSFFDYVFCHDVIHHIDEFRKKKNYIKGLRELRRVCKKGGFIIIVEGNRYNPLFYPHMVKIRGHEHLAQGVFKRVVKEVFARDYVKFKFFEAHAYPFMLLLFKIYEALMENFFPKRFLAYNAAIIKKA